MGVTIDSSGPFIEDIVGQNQLTLTFDVEGAIPAEGIEFLLESDTFDILGDFDIASIVTEGFAEGGFGGTGIAPVEFGRGFVGTILEDGATLTVDVANDAIDEGEQTINFNLVDGELYDVDSANANVSLTIVDPTPDSTIGTQRGSDGDNIVGGTNNNFIDVGNGNDFVDGNAGNDTIEGGNGEDTLFGSDGNDSINGGNGNDIIETGLEGFADFAFGDNGNDTLIGGILENGDFVPSFGNVTFDGGNGDDFLQGGGQRATISGGRGNDTIFGGGNDSVLDGGNGDDFIEAVGSTSRSGQLRVSDDTIIGGQGNDTIFAFADDDIIDGGNGADVIYGGEDDDTITGGQGRDIFVLAPGEGTDTITDFGVGGDVIGLSGGLSFSGLSFAGSDIIFG
ncbi:MAG: calcium-binding protein, partial [Cyanobacteria bacterium J06553_1]